MSMDEETYSVMFTSLKHPIRRKILRILASSTKSFTDILQQVDIESAHLSYHLEGLDGLLKKNAEGKYSLSDLGRAGLSLMTRIEEPVKLVSPVFLQTPRRLKIARLSFLAITVLGLLLLANGVYALSSLNLQKSWAQTDIDTDHYVFEPVRILGAGGYSYFGDGLYGVEMDFVLQDAYSSFPLIVRLSTGGATNTSIADYWNQSWYEWSRADMAPVPGQRERLSVTFFARGSSPEIVSQTDFSHVHPSPGRLIGRFRPTGGFVMVKVASEINTNVTLSGFRAFQSKWFYFPTPDDTSKNISVLLGTGLIIPSLVFILRSRYLEPLEKKQKTTPPA